MGFILCAKHYRFGGMMKRLLILTFLAIAAPSGFAEISTLLETKDTNKIFKFSFKPKLEWVQRSQVPLTDDPDANDLQMENFFGIRFKLAKKHKVSFRLSSISEFQSSSREEKAQHQLGDAHFRWVDSSWSGLFHDTDIILTHKLYVPMRDRSRQRTEITHYKGWALLSRPVAPRWTLIANFIPTIYAFREANYLDDNGKRKANALYDLYASGQIMYQVNDEWFLTAEAGWGRREYLRFKGEREREDTLPVSVAVNWIASDDLDLALGVTSENSTNDLKFNRIRPFPADATTVFLETNLNLF